MYPCQVLLVAGGFTGFNSLVSTEIHVIGSSSWVEVGDLPTVPIRGLRGASINNNIIMTGTCFILIIQVFTDVYT